MSGAGGLGFFYGAAAFSQNAPCAARWFFIITRHAKRGPFVYRLGRQVFNLERGVRLPYGLPFI